MKKTLLTLGIAGLIAGFSSSAFADVSGLTVRFGGGCLSSNTTGTCVLKVTADGTDLDSETVQVYSSADSNTAVSRVSRRLYGLDSSGRVTIRTSNVAGGCFQVRTGPNGNDKPDVKSRTKCE